MATILQLRRGTTTQHSSFAGAIGEVTVDTTKKTIVVHDGVTSGGSALATEDYVTSQLSAADNTDEITEGSTNLYFTTARARSAISAGTGISITDGAISTTITQYADSDARTAISITDAGGDGSLAYNNTTGVITYTGPSASDVRAHFSAGTGIAITNGSVAVDSTIATKTYADNAATTAVANVIDTAPEALNTLNELAAALGDDANFATTVTTSIGTKLDSSAVSAFGLTLVDDADAATARTTLGLGTAATTAASAYATAAQGATADAALPSADFNTTFDTRLGTKSTTNLAEGTSLYFTNARARDAVSASGDLSYNSTTGAFSFTQDKAFSSLTGTPTTLTGYGISDAYTKTEVDSAITTAVAAKDNSDEITEGSTNLYFTTARARSAISAGTGISITDGAVAVDSTIATKTYADNAATTAVAAVIDTAPDALNTLNELAAALGDDANFATTVTTSIGTKLNSSAVSAFGLTLVDDADAATARTTLGLGTAATTAASAYATSAQGTKADNALPAANVSTFGGTLIDDVDAATARTTLGLGTAATTAASAYATAAQGTKADNALPAASVSVFGGTLIDDADAATARTTLGLGTAATTAASAYATAAQGATADAALPSADFNSTFDTRLGTKSTTNLTEGTNLYFTTARARGAISAGTGITITDGAVAVDSTIATKTYADNAATTAVANVIDAAPATLDTLNELAAALGDDANFATTVTDSIATKLNSSAVSAFGLTLVDDADAAAARTTLGLGTAATTAASAYATAAQGTKADNALPAASVSTFGGTLIDDADAAAARTTLGLGTAATTAATAYATAAQGTKADDALPSANFNTTFDTRLGTKSTTNLSEGTNLYFTNARARGAISAGTGITITDGAIATTITQYTDALARAAISVTDSGGDGALSYNNTSGVITYTGPSAANVRAHFSAGTGITITDGAVAVDSTIATKTYADNAATTAVANVIDTAPAALNTLNELAAALGDDANFSTTITTSIGTKLNSSAVSAFGLTLVDDADAAAARTTLGLGTAATTASSAYATAAQGTLATNALPASSVSAFGLTLVDDASAAAARTTLGLGTAATTAATAYATATQGATADAALPASSVSAFGLTLVDDASAAAARTTLGLGTAATTASTAYATAAQGTKADNALPAASYTAADVLTKLKTVDGAGSGLDADLLDGNSSAHFRINIYDAAGTLLN